MITLVNTKVSILLTGVEDGVRRFVKMMLSLKDRNFTMETISNHKAQTELSNGISVIIDVREPSEYNDQHIPGALNFPSTKYRKDDYTEFENKNICLVCQSGGRAKQIEKKLRQDGFSNLYILQQQMESIPRIYTTKGWTVDRQFRMTLGVALAVFLLLNYFGIQLAVIIPVILSLGLIITSIIDRCYMRMGIAMLPWNRGKSVPK